MEQPNARSLGPLAGRPRPARARRRAPVPHLLRRRAGVPRRERGARWLIARSSPRCSPASRARARWRCASATARSQDVQAAHLRAAALLRGVPARAALHRGARHHRAHLRHLPGRLPDELDRGDGGRLRRRGAPTRSARCAGCSIAASGSRATRCTSSCSTRRTSSGTRTRFEMARDHREVVERALAAQEGGQRRSCASSAGARSIRSTSASAASTARRRAPSSRRWWSELERAREFALEAVALHGVAAVPGLRGGLRLRRAARPGRATRSRADGWSRAPGSTSRRREYEEHVVEEHVEHSTALHSRLRDGTRYLVGPLARYALNRDRLSPAGARGRRRRGPRAGVPQPVPQHRRARGGDPLRARRGAAAASTLTSRPIRRPSRSSRARASGYGWTEAPRGLLWHRYAIDDDGHDPRSAKIVPPTSQNQGRIEQSLHGFVQQHVELADDELHLRCEQAVRSYDPCISCATHFLRLEVDRG